jgi:polyhydroxybutyrate depolymerase
MRAVQARALASALSAWLAAAAFCAASAEPIQLAVDGQSRAYMVERAAASGPRPTIIMLHGAGGSAAREAQFSPLARLGPQQGYAAVFPDGRGGRWNFHPPGKETAVDAEFFRQYGGMPDDVAFIKLLVADLIRRGISDPRRVHLVGLSLGGVMALRMACINAEMFAAIGLLISAMADVNGTDCRPAKPLPALILNGTGDQLIPYGGGRTIRGDMVWPAERLVAFFRRLNGCSEPVLTSAVWSAQPQSIDVEFSGRCVGGPVAFYRVAGGGHTVPETLGAGQMLLDFFADKIR